MAISLPFVYVMPTCATSPFFKRRTCWHICPFYGLVIVCNSLHFFIIDFHFDLYPNKEWIIWNKIEKITYQKNVNLVFFCVFVLLIKRLVDLYLWAFHGHGNQKFSRGKSNMSQNLDFFLPKKAHIDISTKKLFFHNMVPIGFEPASFLPKNAYIMFWTHNFCHEMLTLGIEPTTFAKKCYTFFESWFKQSFRVKHKKK